VAEELVEIIVVHMPEVLQQLTQAVVVVAVVQLEVVLVLVDKVDQE
jgi:hypothetical protein